MLFSNIAYLDEHFFVHENAYIGVQEQKIAYIGDCAPQEDYGETYDGCHGLLMPGLVNAHAHSAMTLLRGYAENLPLDRWLGERVFPFEDHLTNQAVDAASRLAIAEMLRFGTVSFSDMYFFCQTTADAVLQSGIKCNLSRGLTVFDDSDYTSLPAYRDNLDLLSNYHNAGGERLKIDLCIHGEYTSTPKVVEAVARHAQETGSRVQIHLSETKAEHEACKERHGKTPAQYFADIGLFDAPTTAAHCVWLESDDFDILREKNVSVAACPASNLKLASGFANVPEMLKRGINVALGTDGAASNNNLNEFQDLYLFSILYKGSTANPTVITPAQALFSATVAGAKAQGRTDCGTIKVGNRADLIVLNTDVPGMYPKTNIPCNLTTAAQGNDVVLTMVDGKVLYRDGEYLTIDIERAKYDTQHATNNILEALK